MMAVYHKRPRISTETRKFCFKRLLFVERPEFDADFRSVRVDDLVFVDSVQQTIRNPENVRHFDVFFGFDGEWLCYFQKNSIRGLAAR